LESIAEFVGEFEEGEVVDLLEAQSLGEDAGGFDQRGHGDILGMANIDILASNSLQVMGVVEAEIELRIADSKGLECCGRGSLSLEWNLGY
jgi:hypothetical protein